MGQSSWLRQLMELSLVRGPLPWAIWALCAVGLLALYVALVFSAMGAAERASSAGGGCRAVWRVPGMALGCAAGAGALGLLGAWLLSDVLDVFRVSLGWPVMFTVAAGFAMVGFAGYGIAVTRRWKRALAVVLVPVSLLSAALGVDVIYGEYQTVGSLVGYSPYADFGGVSVHRAIGDVSRWRREAASGRLPQMPERGRTLTVGIPASASGFEARKAMVYLPPAALSSRPPELPAMELMAGQPGSPSRLIDASDIAARMDAYAAAHDGLAPVVIVPDQNGSDSHNSLCADTSQGKAETYLTKDVVDWAKAHLPVSSKADMWAIGGFSQGGTCTTQLGPRHPGIYGTMMPVDGELKPTNGTVAEMVASYFDGDRERYEEQVPVKAIASHAPSSQVLFAGAGERDGESVRSMRAIASAARKAGMSVTEVVVPGTGHDWHVVQTVWEPAIEQFCARAGLGEHVDLNDYPQVEVLR